MDQERVPRRGIHSWREEGPEGRAQGTSRTIRSSRAAVRRRCNRTGLDPCELPPAEGRPRSDATNREPLRWPSSRPYDVERFDSTFKKDRPCRAGRRCAGRRVVEGGALRRGVQARRCTVARMDDAGRCCRGRARWRPRERRTRPTRRPTSRHRPTRDPGLVVEVR